MMLLRRANLYNVTSVVRFVHIRVLRRTICKETKTCVIFVDFDLATVIYRIVFNKIQ